MATSIDDHDIPNTYLRQFFRYLGSRESLLADTSETPDSLSQLGGRNSFRDHCRFFHNAIAELNSPGIGLVLGRLNQISNMHGALGTAIFNSQTIGDCLQLLQRYLPLRMPFIRVDRVQEGDSEGLTFTFLHDDPAIHPALCEALLLGVNSVIALISRQSMQSSILELDYPPPSYANDYGSAFQVSSIRFSQPALRLLLPKQAMTYATNTDPDHLLAESAIARCEQLLQGSTCSSNVSTRVTQLFNDNPGRIWPLKEVAGHLNMSVRTLQRRLRDEGCNYQLLQNQWLKKEARQLLADKRLSVESIALLLGYCDVSNFRHACRRWYGMTPIELRQ